ncbi:protein PET54 [Kluyveromyces marxianus]|uniref:Protein PET54 n=1 Tax=Kluyveromyces marxianus (strain DMKU3-1042 / BCC 29191 / NBRC 104275) TaxID=1003335 RepID=W0TEY3_KLUMD|nr:protein PET54 [Kluyveromyces marxianus DMKU3-1042]BAO41351.1 protein PET54 [Kluyveromyces marxianus DMKU3-1042]BAP72802.1 protein PET54 [Kluyveromyces marxianus]
MRIFTPLFQSAYKLPAKPTKSSNKLLKDVFAVVKENPVPAEASLRLGSDDTFLVFRTYNPSLKKEDFQSIINPLSSALELQAIKNSFEITRFRDSRYFTFLDKYVLRFPTQMELKQYLLSTKMSMLDDRKVRFGIKDTKGIQRDLCNYYVNLMNARESAEAYKNGLVLDRSDDSSGNNINSNSSGAVSAIDWDALQETERKSVVVWNLPQEWDETTLQERFWWYDIHHSFPLLVNQEKNTSLTFIYFNEIRDAYLFKNNFHGALVEGNRLMIEKL